MPRPKKCRKVCGIPQSTHFVPKDTQTAQTIQMSVDEYETIRLIDLEGLDQQACAVQMDVARTTVQAIYMSARKKLAECLVRGLGLEIAGGDIRVCEKGQFQSGYDCPKKCYHQGCVHRTIEDKGDSQNE